jgi:general secretion pathway protein N
MSKKRIALLSAAAFLLWLVLLIAKMPAEFALGQVAKNTSNFSVAGVNGTVWQGSAGAMQLLVNRQKINLGRVEWQISPWALLLGRLQIALDAKQQQQIIRGNFSVSATQNVQVSDAELMVSSALLTKLYPVPAKINGFIELNLLDFKASIPEQRVDALDGQLVIKDLDVTVQKQAALGTFGVRLSLDDSKERVLANITDVDAKVSVSGEASLHQVNKTYAADLLIKPTAEADPVIANTLQYVAKKQNDGSFKFNYSGKLN